MPGVFRGGLATGVVALWVLLAAIRPAAADTSVDPRLRYQLLSIAVEASRVCEWARRDLGAYALTRREQLAAKLLTRDLTDAADLALIRKRARRIFHAQGCQSQAIADLVATVRRVEGGQRDR